MAPNGKRRRFRRQKKKMPLTKKVDKISRQLNAVTKSDSNYSQLSLPLTQMTRMFGAASTAALNAVGAVILLTPQIDLGDGVGARTGTRIHVNSIDIKIQIKSVPTQSFVGNGSVGVRLVLYRQKAFTQGIALSAYPPYEEVFNFDTSVGAMTRIDMTRPRNQNSENITILKDKMFWMEPPVYDVAALIGLNPKTHNIHWRYRPPVGEKTEYNGAGGTNLQAEHNHYYLYITCDTDAAAIATAAPFYQYQILVKYEE